MDLGDGLHDTQPLDLASISDERFLEQPSVAIENLEGIQGEIGCGFARINHADRERYELTLSAMGSSSARSSSFPLTYPLDSEETGAHDLWDR
jgi:hypothetical protein